MAKYSAKMMGKEVGQAGIYAPPHTMQGKKVSASTTAVQGAYTPQELKASVGNISAGPSHPEAKTSGIKMRGAGAATKGTMARGPMG